MTAGIAALPMYDWPQSAAALDRLWVGVRDRLRRDGLRAPEALDRTVGLSEGWLRPDLVLGQTCGLPLVGPLAGRVAVVGAADYRLPGCPPGWYRSAVVARTGSGRALADFRGARLAINGRDSQSGWGSMLHHVAPLAEDGRFFGTVTVTGAHVRSVAAVAAGKADIAAIDLVTWGHCRRVMPAAAALEVLMLTDPTPGLPYIAAAGADVATLGRALEAAIGELGAEDRAAMGGIAAFVPLTAGDYRVVGERIAAAGSAAAA